MASQQDLDDWVHKALADLGGRGTIAEVCKHIWQHHEKELRGSGDLFYKWQYDMRWAADHLRRAGFMKPANVSPKGLWELTQKSKR